MKFLVNWLIALAKRTPYFHLDGYMKRWWLVPYRQVIPRKVWAPGLNDAPAAFVDGTGPVPFWRRPIAWCFQQFDIAIRVHEILRSDLGRDPHDHPWPYLTLILKGGYFEKTFDAQGRHLRTTWHGPGSVLYRPAGTWHQLFLPMDEATDFRTRRPCVTLFITGPKVQRWGFLTPDGKVPYDKYPGRN